MGVSLDGTPETRVAAVGIAEDEATSADSVRRLCSSTQLSRILGVSLARIRGWSRAGLIRPERTVHRLELFEFRQVAAAKSLADLVRAGVSIARIRASLDRVRTWLPGAEETLAGRPLLGSGGGLCLRLEGGELADPTGQLLFDFDSTPARCALPLPRSPGEWLREAQRREESGELSEAARAYHEALAGDPRLAEARFGLANVLYLLEDAAEAAAEYLRAVEIDPEYIEAWNNLGNALAELGEVDAALSAYRRALAIEPEYGDARFNLAEALWSDGALPEARAHYREVLLHDPTSPWSKHVEERIGGESPLGGG